MAGDEETSEGMHPVCGSLSVLQLAGPALERGPLDKRVLDEVFDFPIQRQIISLHFGAQLQEVDELMGPVRVGAPFGFKETRTDSSRVSDSLNRTAGALVFGGTFLSI